MRLDQLYEFCKVVETGSLRKASEGLFTSPQNVSKSMIQLEQELGVVLYDRGPRGVACYIPLDPEIRFTGYMPIKKSALENPFTRILQGELEKRHDLEVLF